ncbi:MAG: AAA family ATPase [Ruminococcus sp.]|jgi:hypothetical protein
MNEIVMKIPEMKTGQELVDALSVYPKYEEAIRYESRTVRLVRLSDLYQLYIPSQMSTEIYFKLYLSLLRSVQKKETQAAVQQQNQNGRAIRNQESRGILGGTDSFTIIGTSGIGKSSAIHRAIDLMTENQVIERTETYGKILPCVTVQCPFDSSVKGLLLEILRKVDEALESHYYPAALRARATTDMLIGSVSQVALNHIGLLIVDEIQNVVNSKNGKSLVGSLTQLINNSGIAVGMVGTPECIPFFEQAMQLARRSVGLQYLAMPYDAYFELFCKEVFRYQYVREKTELTPAITEWLYEHSAGIVSVVVALIHDAQELAIGSGKEKLDLSVLHEAYQKRLTFLHGYLQPSVAQKSQTSRRKKRVPVGAVIQGEGRETCIEKPKVGELRESPSILELAKCARTEKLDMAELLKEHYLVEEVTV